MRGKNIYKSVSVEITFQRKLHKEINKIKYIHQCPREAAPVTYGIRIRSVTDSISTYDECDYGFLWGFTQLARPMQLEILFPSPNAYVAFLSVCVVSSTWPVRRAHQLSQKFLHCSYVNTDYVI